MKKGLISIIILYAIAVIFLLLQLIYLTGVEKIISLVLLPIAVIVLIGLIKKNDLARKSAIIIAWIGILMSLILFLLMLWVYFYDSPDNELITIMLVRGGVEILVIIINVLIIRYLRKVDVARIFKYKRLTS